MPAPKFHHTALPALHHALGIGAAVQALDHRKDRTGRIAYFITYGVMFLGIAASAVRCYFGWTSIPVIGKTCLVLGGQFSGTQIDTKSICTARGMYIYSHVGNTRYYDHIHGFRSSVVVVSMTNK